MPEKWYGPHGDTWSQENLKITTPGNQWGPTGVDSIITLGAKSLLSARCVATCSEGELSNNGWEEKRQYILQACRMEPFEFTRHTGM